MCLSYAHIAVFILCYLSLTELFNATKTFPVSYICLFFYTFVHQTQPTVHLCMLLPHCCGRRWITRGCSPVNAFERLGYSKCPTGLFAGPKDNLHIFKVIKAHIAYENVQIEYLNMYSGFSILPCREGGSVHFKLVTVDTSNSSSSFRFGDNQVKVTPNGKIYLLYIPIIFRIE